ncbi:GNAT family protein [Streptomyces sp. IB2014 016-6]|uniref:GNAT family N-acetyltransferase n=1 Tax=Streptomyces sp. IB2014 016-6 TaxID=2517818 RepID=UPI001F4F5130|nr:GNAT family protein [Streptomyces sp. IB2014 016-6]
MKKSDRSQPGCGPRDAPQSLRASTCGPYGTPTAARATPRSSRRRSPGRTATTWSTRLAPAVQGRGLGREPAVALTAHGHDPLGLAEVHATVDEGNAPSLSLLARLGYTRVRDIAGDGGGTTSHLTHRRR